MQKVDIESLEKRINNALNNKKKTVNNYIAPQKSAKYNRISPKLAIPKTKIFHYEYQANVENVKLIDKIQEQNKYNHNNLYQISKLNDYNKKIPRPFSALTRDESQINKLIANSLLKIYKELVLYSNSFDARIQKYNNSKSQINFENKKISRNKDNLYFLYKKSYTKIPLPLSFISLNDYKFCYNCVIQIQNILKIQLFIEKTTNNTLRKIEKKYSIKINDHTLLNKNNIQKIKKYIIETKRLNNKKKSLTRFIRATLINSHAIKKEIISACTILKKNNHSLNLKTNLRIERINKFKLKENYNTNQSNVGKIQSQISQINNFATLQINNLTQITEKINSLTTDSDQISNFTNYLKDDTKNIFNEIIQINSRAQNTNSNLSNIQKRNKYLEEIVNKKISKQNQTLSIHEEKISEQNSVLELKKRDIYKKTHEIIVSYSQTQSKINQEQQEKIEKITLILKSLQTNMKLLFVKIGELDTSKH